MKKFILGAVLSIGLLLVTAQYWLPVLFVSIGKGSFSKENVTVIQVVSSGNAVNAYGEPITAEAGRKFAHFDLHISLPIREIDYYDFQLVKRNDYELGREENIGDTLSDNYFSALPLKDDNSIAGEWDLNSRETTLRLSFEVPETASRGFLFYWGEYIGPLQF